MAEAEANASASGVGLDPQRRAWAERVFFKYSNAQSGLLSIADFHTICACEVCVELWVVRRVSEWLGSGPAFL